MTTRTRPETADDWQGIRAVHLAAFPTAAEAGLVEMLRDDRDCAISLVAEEIDATATSRIVGHIMLSRMQVTGDGRPYRALGLGPVAVLPACQGQGLGAALIHEALHRAEQSGEELLFVLGEPRYYGRFGFTAAAAAPFASPYAGGFFMAKTLGVPLPQSGSAQYAPAFSRLG